MTFLVFLCFVEIFYAYAGYPIILFFLIRLGFRRKVGARGDVAPSVSIIITVRNEFGAIRDKLDNTLDLRVGGKFAAAAGVQVIVASDASDDGTDKIVLGYARDGVELVRLDERGGKEQAQKKAVAAAKGEIIVFTDAKIRLEPDALEKFIEYFRDPTVGAVSSVDCIEGEGSGEGMYVKYEMWLRQLESDFSSLVGLSGSCFAVRKVVAVNIRTDIPSDFALLLEARRLGLTGVNAPDIVGTYQAVPSAEAEFKRKVRTVLRGMTALFSCVEVLNPARYGIFAWQVASHKLGRWLVPWACVVGAAAVLAGAQDSWFLMFLELCLVAYGILVTLGYFHPGLREKIYCKLPLYFFVVNAGIAVAWWNFFIGKRTVAWTPSSKGS